MPWIDYIHFENKPSILLFVGNTFMKPKYIIDLEKDDHPVNMILRAGSISAAHGLKKESRDIHQEASVYGYDFYIVLKLLKKYMEI